MEHKIVLHCLEQRVYLPRTVRIERVHLGSKGVRVHIRIRNKMTPPLYIYYVYITNIYSYRNGGCSRPHLVAKAPFALCKDKAAPVSKGRLRRLEVPILIVAVIRVD